MEESAINNKTEEKTPSPRSQKFIVGVQHRPAGKIYTFITDDATLVRGDHVVVEDEHGSTIGTIILSPQEVKEIDLSLDTKKVLHRATREELELKAQRGEREHEILEIFLKKAKEHALKMKPVAAQLKDGDKKVVLIFYAEERVDFRNLVKDLASTLHMRIEMHQIGARDEVKARGGSGPCGLVTCCSLHLRQFQSISIQMAKTQGLAPNPVKLAGLCGKLKCCLAYENALYAELKQRFPKVGAFVTTPQGKAKVTGLEVLSENCVVRLEDGTATRIALSDILPEEKPA